MNIELKTEGMHCPSCEMLVVDSLQELDGVDVAHASFKTGIIKVSFDETKVDKMAVINVIKKEGYKVRRE